jgi:hypothetical protein
MDFECTSFRNSLPLVNSDPYLKVMWEEVTSVLNSISDQDIISKFISNSREAKSISEAINELIDEKLVEKKWVRQSKIFRNKEYENKTWTLDFSKSILRENSVFTGMAVEVAFNHGEAIAWNLIKPSLAAEVNHLEKETDIGSGVGVFICASKELKMAGGFDNAVGEYEKVLKYLVPLSQMITTPIVVLGLKAPKTFKIETFFDKSKNRKVGQIVKN